METVATDFGGGEQLLLNLILAAMVFGLALDIDPREFRRIFKSPRGPLTGVAAQFLLLPAITCALTLFVDLDPGIELGMIMVAVCPGGVSSNVITLLARGSVALSITMTAISSLLAIFLLPLNFAFWAGMNAETASLLQTFDVDAGDIFDTLLLVLAIPLLLGQFLRAWNQRLAWRIHSILKPLSVLALIGFIVIAVSRNIDLFLAEFWLLFGVVVAHNTAAFTIGYISGRIARLDGPDTRAVTIEVGIQNSSLAIAIILTYFASEPGMAMIAAFWGTWHLIAGFMLAASVQLWFRLKRPGDFQASKE